METNQHQHQQHKQNDQHQQHKQNDQQKHEQKQKKKEEKHNASNYCNTMKSKLMVTIFNEKTRQESEKYRNEVLPKGAAIYCSPLPVAQTIPMNSNMLVLEMNNDTNQIIAVGIVQNRPHIEKYNVYKDVNESYNRFVYMGKYRIRREDMTAEEETIMKVFDQLCFKGKYHMKRGQGIRSFPSVILWKCRNVLNLVEFIENMFKRRITPK